MRKKEALAFLNDNRNEINEDDYATMLWWDIIYTMTDMSEDENSAEIDEYIIQIDEAINNVA